MGYLKLLRPLNAALAAATILLAAFLAGGLVVFTLPLLLAAAATFLSAGAGNVINDIFDAHVDAVNRPSRPLPSGAVPLRNAHAYYYFLLLLSQGVVVPVGIAAFAFVALCNGLLFLYSYSQKKYPFRGHVIVAVLTALPFVFGAWLSGNPAAALVPAIFALVVTFMREVVKAMQDVPGDRMFSKRTAATEWPVTKLSKLLLAMAVVLVCLTVTVYLIRVYSVLFTVAMAVLVLPLIVAAVKYAWTAGARQLRLASICLKVALFAGGLALIAGKL